MLQTGIMDKCIQRKVLGNRTCTQHKAHPPGHLLTENRKLYLFSGSLAATTLAKHQIFHSHRQGKLGFQRDVVWSTWYHLGTILTTKMLNLARRQWLTPIILTTREAAIRRTKVQGQARAHSTRDPILKIPSTKQGWQSASDGKSVCPPSVRSFLQTPVPQKKKKMF
jgi:hypothetical protein